MQLKVPIILLTLYALFQPLSVASEPQNKVDHVLIQIMNWKREEPCNIRIYAQNDSFICVYYDFTTDKTIKAIQYDGQSVNQLQLRNLVISKSKVVLNGRTFAFKEKSWIGPSTAHPEPTPLPPLPDNPK